MSRQFFISSNRGNLTQSKGLLCPGSSVVERLFCKQDVGGSIPSQGYPVSSSLPHSMVIYTYLYKSNYAEH